MERVFLITVRHTGTRFFLDLIENAINEKHVLLEEPFERPLKPYKLAFAHSNVRDFKLIEEYIDAFHPLIVVTERDEVETLKSWEKRRRKAKVYAADRERLLAITRKHETNTVSVDASNRDELLSALSQKIGVELHTDWSPVGAYGGHGRQYVA